uniref:Gamma tubulin complex component protein N-terminal domain-containing protein n=1 Tax=Electrophorus electricus TaxID=8005 RepID=A0AAY5EYV9_ELEEL
MAALDQKSPNVLLQSLCCRITGKSEADVAHQFQYAVRVIGSNYAPTIERDEFLVSEKIKKELLKQRREADAALFSELHRKLQTQGVLKYRWSILYLLLSLCEDSRKPSSRVCSYGGLFAQALPRDAHSTPFYYARPQSLCLSYPDRSTHNASSGIGSLPNGPAPSPQPLLSGQTRPRLLFRPRHGVEAALVRDILYVFQGIDGKFIKMCPTEECYRIDAKVPLCKSLRDTSHRLAELGWLHDKVRKYADSRSLDRAFGLVGQSFCASLHQELKEYYRLLSVLHAQLQVEDDQGMNVGADCSLTLRRLLVWTYDPKVRLKTLAALVDFCQGRKGGELASAVHAYGKTGDPHMRALVQHILGLVSHPILNFLYRWIYDGELEDTYHEVRTPTHRGTPFALLFQLPGNVLVLCSWKTQCCFRTLIQDLASWLGAAEGLGLVRSDWGPDPISV